ncbi:MAG: transpeptidase family protein [Chitinophagaceae bacterium]|nr:transpeptidase family protein [Chitinophagaceae bacterium]
MEVKQDILWRVYLIFLGIVVFSLFIIGKAVYIQTAEGEYWKGLSDSLHLEYRELDADRGTIYSEDGSMLSTSIPFFDVRIDFGADGLREKNGRRFKENIDSLSLQLAAMFGDQSAAAYKKELSDAYRKRERYYLLKKNITFREYQAMREFPLVRSGRNKSGFIFEDREKRLTPFGLLANRTIGLSREYMGADGRMVNKNVGLEKTYDSLLRGVTGKRLVRRIAGGAFVPIEGSEIEPENGKDILTTLDVNIQDIAQQALMKMMIENECEHGTCIVMEVKTGKIKAMANLGRQPDGSYYEDFNYAIAKSEPGSTFKLVTLLSVLEDKYTTLDHTVNLEGGVWKTAGRTVYDSEKHGRTQVTVKQAFELSSNVGMAKLVTAYYSQKPQAFLDHLYKLRLDTLTGLGLLGENKPVIPKPKSRYWSAPTLPWMAFGYNLSLTPLHTLMIYNAVANDGKMMKPYLVNAVLKDGRELQQFGPEVLKESICSEATLQQLRECLEGVVTEGTARSLMTPYYTIAGKTGTALVANGTRGYADHIYQSSFAGYFPADNPRYSCIVVIRNKPFARKYYGGLVAGPVFREVADKLHALDAGSRPAYTAVQRADSSFYAWSGWNADYRNVYTKLHKPYRDSAGKSRWAWLVNDHFQPTTRNMPVSADLMPSLKGMGLKDALYLLENMKLKVVANGRGKVRSQSIREGTAVVKGQTVYLELGA